jgi:hypothetical protein
MNTRNNLIEVATPLVDVQSSACCSSPTRPTLLDPYCSDDNKSAKNPKKIKNNQDFNNKQVNPCIISNEKFSFIPWNVLYSDVEFFRNNFSITGDFHFVMNPKLVRIGNIELKCNNVLFKSNQGISINCGGKLI